jgi:hypothetical protein
MSREGGFPKYQFERISPSRVALHTSGDEPVEFVSARAGIRIGLHVANLPTLKSFINRTAREIMAGSNVLSCTECTENLSRS